MTNGERILAEIRKRWGKDVRLIFISYCRSMWDSMESIQAAAIKKGLVADVYPVPYMAKGTNTVHFEGGYINEVMLFNTEQYDVAVINYPFDDINTLTCFQKECQSKALKAAGLKVVYVPYYGFYASVEQITKPVVYNANLICVHSEKDAEPFREIGVETTVTGSPKVDAYKKAKKGAVCIANSLIPFLNNPGKKLTQYRQTIAGLYNKGDMIIFRAHPLMMEGILRYRPDYEDEYKDFLDWAKDYCLMDNSKTPWRTLKNCKMVIGDGASMKMLCEAVGLEYVMLA